ncbi:TetR/AcrR family transcriptional regulator [Microtetraspora malaysiensis]|uniref:TetR/AcrR family transcriptional regulator n=1 Tax=Microtetraspora malaysiensis TaxID=161358 RepID=UPI003D94CB71
MDISGDRGTNKDTRGRIMDASGGLFRRNGYTGTGLKQIATAAGAPFGSIYHFFPGGKEQLGAEVIRWSGEMYLRLFETAMDAAPDVVTGVHNFFAGAAETLRETDYADACPIAAVALEVASTNEPLRQATAEVFTGWIAAGTEHLVTSGLSRETGRTLMISMLAGLEGAFVLSRALRSTEPVEVAGATAVAAVREALRELR